MNLPTVWTTWLQLLGLLAGEVALVVAVAAALDRFARTASWQRVVWQACFLGLLTLALLELSGAARALSGWVRLAVTTGPREATKHVPVAASLEQAPAPLPPYRVSDEFRQRVVERLFASAQTSSIQPVSEPDCPTLTQLPAAEWTPPAAQAVPTRAAAAAARRSVESVLDSFALLVLGSVWLVGSAAVFGRIAFNWLVVGLFRWTRRPAEDARLNERMACLARRLGIRRRVRLSTSRRLASPIAFGVLRPAVVLPANFTRDFNETQQAVMLAHELSHIAAGDPFWYLLADGLTALLWWHPLVWWGRRRFYAAAETAADEASLPGPTRTRPLTPASVSRRRKSVATELCVLGLRH